MTGRGTAKLYAHAKVLESMLEVSRGLEADAKGGGYGSRERDAWREAYTAGVSMGVYDAVRAVRDAIRELNEGD